jgi:Tfp pilus assembly protein PilP
MKLTTGIVALALTAGTAWAQNPANILGNTKTSLQGVQQQKTAAINGALEGTGTPAKPSPAAPAKPASAAKPAPAPVKVAATPAPVPVKPALAKVVPKTAVKVVPAKAAAVSGTVKAAAPKIEPTTGKTTTGKTTTGKTTTGKATTGKAKASAASAAPDAPKPEKQEDKKYSMTGKRDPFLSPVVNRQGGSACSTGKKCLDIDQLAVRGVVKSDNGMIAVVTNRLNKAYFLRENDPVFNGYVLKITVDSVVFKQNFQDRLGKPFTKDVVKRLTTPAV